MRKVVYGKSINNHLMGALAPFLLVSPVLAQSTEASGKIFPEVQVKDAPLEYRQFEKVEITGSSIIAREAKEALPVQVITRQEIERRKIILILRMKIQYYHHGLY